MTEVQASDIVTTLPFDGWDAPADPGLQSQTLEALEAGRVLYLPRLAFSVRQEERGLLDAGAGDARRKNVSLDPATGRLGGTATEGPERDLLTEMLQRYAEATTALLLRIVPSYAGGLRRARTSFRPTEIVGRSYSVRHDDRRLHIDAFPTRPLRGERILRVFSNIAPDGSARVWHVGEDFAGFAQAFLPRVRAALPGQSWLLAQLGLTTGRRSRYDHFMLGLHDAAKRDEAYQAHGPRSAIAFAAGTTWLCFTDRVLHAAMSGRCALEQTFHLPVDAMASPDQAPLCVLERLAGRRLA